MQKFLILISIISTLAATPTLETIELKCKIIRKTVCHNNDIKVLQSGMELIRTDKTNFDTLFINEATVEFLPVNIEKVFPSLKILKITDSSLKEVVKLELKMLQEVNFEKNQITSLPEDAFKQLTSLKKIILYSNKIKSLPPTIFSNNQNLIYISIAKNELRTLSDQTFKNLEKLKEIDISNNLIEDLYAGTFDDCTNLKTLSIHNNKLLHVGKDILKNNKNLKVMKNHFINNTCLNDFLDTEVNINLNDLMQAFNSDCKPHCYEEVENLKKDIENLNSELKSSNKSNKELEKDLEKSKKQHSKAKDDVKSCEDDKKQNDEKLSECEKDMLNISKNISDTTAELENLKNSTENFNQQLTSCMSNLTDTKELLDIKLKEIEDCESNRTSSSRLFTKKLESLLYYEEEAKLCMENVTSLTNELELKNIKNFQLSKELEDVKLQLTFFNNAYKVGIQSTASIKTQIINCKVENTNSYVACSINNIKATSTDITVDVSGTENINGIKFVDSKFIKLPNTKINSTKYFKVVNSAFLYFDEDICRQSTDIEVFSVISSNIGWTVRIDSCKALKTLYIENSGVKDVQAEYSIPTLTLINLRGNRIEEVTAEFFSKFKELKIVQMSNNIISRLDGNIFDGNEELENVNFSNNPIKRINGNIFSYNLKLMSVAFTTTNCFNKEEYNRNKINAFKQELINSCR